MKITKLGIVGSQIVTDQWEAIEAARVELDHNGDSEGDSPAQCSVMAVYDGNDNLIRFDVISEWGSATSRSNDNPDVLASFDSEEVAEEYVERFNRTVLESWADCEWIELPRPIEFVYFGGCDRGQYPHSRRATIHATVDGRNKVTGFGNATYIRDEHSHDALKSAVEKLVEALKE